MFKRLPLDELIPILKIAILLGSVVLFAFICWKVFRMRKKDADRMAAMPMDDGDTDTTEETKK
ncbi:MAG: hypothetical protein LBV12_07835 [Puniceicoccales bacterium]|jgi:hypothetical protein|nr:hypothetical protein [Puniceicoccales bacterium]